MKQISLLVLLVLFCCGLHGQELTPSAGTTNSSIKRIYCEELMCRARGLGEERKLKDALRVMDEIIDYDSTYARVYTEKAACLFDLDSLDECLKYCDKSESISGNSAFVWEIRSNVYLRRMDDEKSLNCLNEAWKSKPSAQYLLNKSKLLFNLRRHNEACAMMREYLDSMPNDYEASFEAARLFFKCDSLVPALAFVNEVLDLVPEHVSAWAIKGSILCRKGELDSAIKLYKKTEMNSPEPVNFSIALAKLSFFSDKPDICKRVLDDINELRIDQGRRLQYIYLRLCYNYFMNINTDMEYQEFVNLLKIQNGFPWDFSKTDAWLAKATLTPQQRTLIEDVTKKFKECVGRGNRHSNHNIEAKH